MSATDTRKGRLAGSSPATTRRRGRGPLAWYRDPWRRPRVLQGATWLYLAWSIVPILIGTVDKALERERLLAEGSDLAERAAIKVIPTEAARPTTDTRRGSSPEGLRRAIAGNCVNSWPTIWSSVRRRSSMIASAQVSNASID